MIRLVRSVTIVLLIICCQVSKGQWNNSGAHIYNTNTGGVGIGTPSPLNKLDVAGSVSLSNGGNNILRILQSVNAGAYVGPGTYTNSDMGFGVSNAGKFVWIGKDGNTEIMRLDASGYLGIGTTNPQGILDLHGSTSFLGTGSSDTKIRLRGYNNAYSEIGTNAGSSANYNGLSLTNNANAANGLTTWTMDIGGSDNINYGNYNTISFRNGSSEKMRINANGSVGIGTTTPYNQLEVQKDHDAATFIVARNTANGTSAYTGIKAYGQNQSIGITANSDGLSRSYPGFHPSSVSIMGDAANGLNIISNAGAGTTGANTGMIRFITYTTAGGVTSTEAGNDAYTRMVINGNGYVGVGTITPSERLSVNGNVRAKKVIVTQNGWSDYVFNDSYKLRPLSEVAQYIKDNKHLPDIPTAKEVIEKGVDLGDNQALLLKKIEELTLYMIDLKKENDRLKQEIYSIKAGMKMKSME